MKTFCSKETTPTDGRPPKNKTEIDWSLWTEALCFMMTAMVFNHGMNRFFEKVYAPAPHGMNLLASLPGQFFIMVDFGIFFLESLIIYVAAIRLADKEYRFYATLWCLFWVDTVWAVWWAALLKNGWVTAEIPVAWNYLYLDIAAVVGYGVVYLLWLGHQIEHRFYNYLFLLMTVARTSIDYAMNWEIFYFG